MQAAGLWLAERRQKLKQTQTALPADFCDRACRNKIIIKIRADFGEVICTPNTGHPVLGVF